MPFCHGCGNEVIDSAEICPKCGTRIVRGRVDQTPATTENKIYRSRTDRWITGVCGGLAKHWHTSSLLIRVLFILFGLCLFGFVLYIIAAIVMPEEPIDTIKLSEGT